MLKPNSRKIIKGLLRNRAAWDYWVGFGSQAQPRGAGPAQRSRHSVLGVAARARHVPALELHFWGIPKFSGGGGGAQRASCVAI